MKTQTLTMSRNMKKDDPNYVSTGTPDQPEDV
jgi:hypothetical protein